MIEPDSRTAYVVVAKVMFGKLRTVAASESEIAHVLRITWMRRMWLDEEEIVEALRDDPPVSIHTEMKEWRALDNLDKYSPSADVLRQFAIKY